MGGGRKPGISRPCRANPGASRLPDHFPVGRSGSAGRECCAGDKAAAAWVVRRANTHARTWAARVAYRSARRLLLLAEQKRAAVCGSLLVVVPSSHVVTDDAG